MQAAAQVTTTRALRGQPLLGGAVIAKLGKAVEPAPEPAHGTLDQQQLAPLLQQ